MSEYNDYVWAELYNFIGNEYGVAGLMGNLQAESGVIPFRLQGDFSTNYYKSINYTNNVDSGAISRDEFIHDAQGYGLAQWTYYTRKDALYDMYINGSYSSIGDVRLAIDYLIYELQNNYSYILPTLRNATSIREASDIVLHEFENPEHQDPEVERLRELLSIAIYNEQSGGTPPPTPPIPVPPEPPTPDAPTIPYWMLLKMRDNKPRNS